MEDKKMMEFKKEVKSIGIYLLYNSVSDESESGSGSTIVSNSTSIPLKNVLTTKP